LGLSENRNNSSNAQIETVTPSEGRTANFVNIPNYDDVPDQYELELDMKTNRNQFSSSLLNAE